MKRKSKLETQAIKKIQGEIPLTEEEKFLVKHTAFAIMAGISRGDEGIQQSIENSKNDEELTFYMGLSKICRITIVNICDMLSGLNIKANGSK